MAIVPVHHALVLPEAALDRAEAALDAFVAGDDDPAPLHALLEDLFHASQIRRWTTTAMPPGERWEELGRALRDRHGLLLGPRRQVRRDLFERLPAILARHARLVELEAPAVIIANDVDLLARMVAQIEDTDPPPKARQPALDGVARTQGGSVIDLAQFVKEWIRYLACPFPRDVGLGEGLELDDAQRAELERLALLDDWWFIHRQRSFESEENATSLAPSIVSDPRWSLQRPFFSLANRRSPSCDAWRRRCESLCVGGHGGPLTRLEGASPSWASAPPAGHTLLSLVWIHTENGQPLFR